MAHFAKIVLETKEGENEPKWWVKKVIVVGNDIPTANGPLGENDKAVEGENWCKKLFGGEWKQTSYNNNFRYNFAGFDRYYDPEADAFVGPRPIDSNGILCNSFTLNTTNYQWEAPVPIPSVTTYTTEEDGVTYNWSWMPFWNEETLRWEAWHYPNKEGVNGTKHYWNPETSEFVAI